MLDDAQIASIKQRLHLTPDQEQMWPAVEVALRNIAYTRARKAHQRGAPASTSRSPISIPIACKASNRGHPADHEFQPSRKTKVRNLAHVMGLDQLASQF